MNVNIIILPSTAFTLSHSGWKSYKPLGSGKTRPVGRKLRPIRPQNTSSPPDFNTLFISMSKRKVWGTCSIKLATDNNIKRIIIKRQC